MGTEANIRNEVKTELDANRLSASAASELTGIPYRSILRSLDHDAKPTRGLRSKLHSYLCHMPNRNNSTLGRSIRSVPNSVRNPLPRHQGSV
jgi:hypothetical protein